MPVAGRSRTSPRLQRRRAGFGGADRLALGGGLGADGRHQLSLQPLRRANRLDRGGQQVDGGLQPQQVLGAALTAGQVVLHGLRLGAVEGTQRVGGQVVAHVLVLELGPAHGNTSEASWIDIPSARLTRAFSRPSRIRPLTVPSGSPSMSAISEWLKPPK